ncbi:MAG: hypothetical protein U0232_20795 [Thermomicrobiales bacterium]
MDKLGKLGGCMARRRTGIGLIDQIAEQHSVKLSDIGSQATGEPVQQVQRALPRPAGPGLPGRSARSIRAGDQSGQQRPDHRRAVAVGASASDESALTAALIH